MIHGLDTGFLVAALARIVAVGDQLAITPQVLAEFMHIVTDARRFAQPLDMMEAHRLAEQWWNARDVQQIFSDDQATLQFLVWMQQHSLGRKRLLDTLLAATYRQAGIQSLLTTNAGDFAIFGGFNCLTRV